MALSLLSEEMRLGNRGKAQNYDDGAGPLQVNAKIPLCLTLFPTGKASLKAQQTWLVSFRDYSNLFWPGSTRRRPLCVLLHGFLLPWGESSAPWSKQEERLLPKTGWSFLINYIFHIAFGIAEERPMTFFVLHLPPAEMSCWSSEVREQTEEDWLKPLH